MKSKLYLPTIILVFFSSLLFAQERSERDKEQHQKERVKGDQGIKIHTNEGILEIENFVEDLGQEVEYAVDQIAKNIEVNFDDESFNVNPDFNFDFDFDFDDFGDRLSKSIESMVNNMEIELNDLRPEDLEDSSISDRKGRDVIREIEKEHNAKVEMIEKMKIKIRDQGTTVDMKVLLDNGKIVEKHFEE